MSVLITDHRRTLHQLDRGELTERNLSAAHRRHQRAGKVVDVIAQLTRVADVDRIALPSFDRRRDVIAADGGHDHFLHFADRQSMPRDLLAFEVEIDEVATCHTLTEDAAGSGDLLQDALEVLTDLLDLSE